MYKFQFIFCTSNWSLSKKLLFTRAIFVKFHDFPVVIAWDVNAFLKVLGTVIFSCLNLKYLKRFSFNRLFLVFILKVRSLICSSEFSLVWNGIASDFVFGWAPDGSTPSYCSSAVCVTYFHVLFFSMYAVEISSFVF